MSISVSRSNFSLIVFTVDCHTNDGTVKNMSKFKSLHFKAHIPKSSQIHILWSELYEK